MKSEKEMLLLFGKAMNEVTNVYHMKFKEKKRKNSFCMHSMVQKLSFD